MLTLVSLSSCNLLHVCLYCLYSMLCCQAVQHFSEPLSLRLPHNLLFRNLPKARGFRARAYRIRASSIALPPAPPGVKLIEVVQLSRSMLDSSELWSCRYNSHDMCHDMCHDMPAMRCFATFLFRFPVGHCGGSWWTKKRRRTNTEQLRT